MTETIFEKKGFTRPSVSMEETGFMIDTAARHQRVIETLHFWGAFMSMSKTFSCYTGLWTVTTALVESSSHGQSVQWGWCSNRNSYFIFNCVNSTRNSFELRGWQKCPEMDIFKPGHIKLELSTFLGEIVFVKVFTKHWKKQRPSYNSSLWLKLQLDTL